MNYELIISIDPGLKGAIGFKTVDTYYVAKMPIKKVGGKNQTDMQALNSLLKEKSKDLKTIVFLEKVQAWGSDTDENPGKRFQIQKMLANYTSLVSVIEILEFDLIEVAPRTWQKHLNFPSKGLSKKERKNMYKQYAKNWTKTNVTLQLSDAICITKFAMEKCAFHKDWVQDAVAKRKI